MSPPPSFSLMLLLPLIQVAFSPSYCAMPPPPSVSKGKLNTPTSSGTQSKSEISTSFGIRADLVHIDSSSNYTKFENLRRGIRRWNRRPHTIKSLGTSLVTGQMQAPVHGGTGQFLMTVGVGTPPIQFHGIVDTGSDLTWTQCQPCTKCFDQTTPIFNPSNSSSFSNVSSTNWQCKYLTASNSSLTSPSCDYTYSYGDSSQTKGFLANETFTFQSASASVSDVSVPNIAFGCSTQTEGLGFMQASGVVALGRGPLSLVSQLNLTKFSYCLTAIGDDKTSPLLFGSLADMTGTDVISTPMLRDPLLPSYYYLSLQGISVGNARLPIPSTAFALQPGRGGVSIDSGTTVTYLTNDAYSLLKQAFVTQMKLPVQDGAAAAVDLCFSATSGNVSVPKLIFHFEGADLDLPVDNYMPYDNYLNMYCLMIMPSGTPLSLFGNMQQQNFQVLYDLGREMISFRPRQCNQL